MRAVMFMFNRGISCVIRAERNCGRLLSVVSSMVQMFLHVTISLFAPFEEYLCIYLFTARLPSKTFFGHSLPTGSCGTSVG